MLKFKRWCLITQNNWTFCSYSVQFTSFVIVDPSRTFVYMCVPITHHPRSTIVQLIWVQINYLFYDSFSLTTIGEYRVRVLSIFMFMIHSLNLICLPKKPKITIDFCIHSKRNWEMNSELWMLMTWWRLLCYLSLSNAFWLARCTFMVAKERVLR